MSRRLALLLLCAGCDPYDRWPDPTTVFPYVYTPLDDLEDYEEVRVETETWTPLVDLEETALYVQKATYHRPDAPVEEVLHFGQARPRSALVAGHPLLSFVGDVMWLGGGWSTFADPVADRLDGLRIGNLETPVSSSHPTDRTQIASEFGLYAFNAPLDVLDALPLDVVQINNNHALDLGDLGVEQTRKALVGRGYQPVGLDDNSVSVVLSDAVRVELVSYTWGVNVALDSAHDLAIVPFGHLDEDIDLGRIGRDIQAARARGASHVVLLLHWGYEYEYWPDPHFMVLARRMVELGADVVVGQGPHVVQPAEICAVNQPLSVPGIGQCAVRTPDRRPRDAAILYSLGNFGTDLETLPLQVGIVGQVTLDPAGGVSGVGYEGVATVQLDGAPALLPLQDLLDDEDYAAEDARLDQLLGTSWKRAR